MTTEASLGGVQCVESIVLPCEQENLESIPRPCEQENLESIPLPGEQENLESITLPGEQENLESIPLPGEQGNQESIPLPGEPKDTFDVNFSCGKALISEEKKSYHKDSSKEDASHRSGPNPFCQRPQSASLFQPRKFFATRSCTLPPNTGSKIECKVLDIDSLPKQSRWDTFKNKIYLSSAFGGTRRMTTMKGSKCCAEHVDMAGTSSQEHDYSTIEGLDLGGLPPMGHKSRKLFSWSQFMQRVHGKKSKDILDTKNEDGSEAAEKVQKKFSIAWFQKKFLGKGSSSDTGLGNGEVSKEVADEEVKDVNREDTNGPTVEEVL